MKIDAHQHFWQYNVNDYDWIDDAMAILKQDFLPDQLFEELSGHQLDGSIAVQARQTEQETDFLLNLASKNSGIKAIIGWVELKSDMIEERLEYYSQFTSNLKGFRHVLQAEPDTFFYDKGFLNGISLLAKYNFTYDILIFHNQLKLASNLIKQFPNQMFVINHIAKPDIKSANIEFWKKDIREIASFENVYCKLSGMATEADKKNWKYDDLMPYLDTVLEVFGTDRVMFGSDWPVCLLAGKYSDIIGVIDRYICDLSITEQEKILGNNAAKFYNIS